MKLEVQLLAQNWFIFNVFNNFGFIGIVLVLFPLCLFWTNIFIAKLISIISFTFKGGGRSILQCKRLQAERRVHFGMKVVINVFD